MRRGGRARGVGRGRGPAGLRLLVSAATARRGISRPHECPLPAIAPPGMARPPPAQRTERPPWPPCRPTCSARARCWCAWSRRLRGWRRTRVSARAGAAAPRRGSGPVGRRSARPALRPPCCCARTHRLPRAHPSPLRCAEHGLTRPGAFLFELLGGCGITPATWQARGPARGSGGRRRAGEARPRPACMAATRGRFAS